MALDTIKLNVGVDGDDLGADNIGGVQYEVVKQAFGVEGDLNLVSAADPLPVTDSAAEVSLAAINIDTSAIAGAVSGTEMQVDVLTLPAIPEGTNNIGDVDVLTRPVATPNKTIGTSVIPLTTVNASTVTISSDINVTGKLKASFVIWFGRRAATAAGAGVNIRVEGYDGTRWGTIAQATTNFAAASDEALTGTVAAGQNVLTCANTSGFVVGEKISIINATLGLCEFGRIKAVSSNTSVTIEDNLVNAQTGSTMYTAAEPYLWEIPVEGYNTIRVVVDAASFTQNSLIVVGMNTLDSIT